MSIFDKLLGRRDSAPKAPSSPEDRVPPRARPAMHELLALRKEALSRVQMDNPEIDAPRAARIKETDAAVSAMEHGRYDEARKFLGKEILESAQLRAGIRVQNLEGLRLELVTSRDRLARRFEVVDRELKKQTAERPTDPRRVQDYELGLLNLHDEKREIVRRLESFIEIDKKIVALDAIPAEKE